MQISSRFSRCFVLALICTNAQLAHAAAPTSNKSYPTMTLGEKKYANTCSPGEKKALRASLLKMQLPAPEQAWKLIDTLLCAEKTPANRSLIRNAMVKNVKAIYEGTGQDPVVETMEPNDGATEYLMASGSVWQTTFEAAESDGWVLQYWTDEVSVAHTTIDYKKAKWIIIEHGSASD